MKTSTQRMLCAALALALVVTLVPSQALASHDPTIERVVPFYFHDGEMDDRRGTSARTHYETVGGRPFAQTSRALGAPLPISLDEGFTVTLKDRSGGAGEYATRIRVVTYGPGDAEASLLADATFEAYHDGGSTPSPRRVVSAADTAFGALRNSTSGGVATPAAKFAYGFGCSVVVLCEQLIGDYGWGAGLGPRPCRSGWTAYAGLGATGRQLHEAVRSTGACTSYTPSNVANATAAAADSAIGPTWTQGLHVANATLAPLREETRPSSGPWDRFALDARAPPGFETDGTTVTIPAGHRLAIEVALEAAPGPTASLAPSSSFVYNSTSADSGLFVRTIQAPEPERPPTTILEEGFEDGAAGWSWSGLWHVSDSCFGARSGARSLQYNREPQCDYNATSPSGNATRTKGNASIAIDLTGFHHSVTVDLWMRYQVEATPGYDRMTAGVSCSAGSLWSEFTAIDTNATAWEKRSLYAGHCLGRQAVLWLTFDSVDPLHNDGMGWAVDDVRVVAT